MTIETPGGSTGTMDPVEIKYLAWDTEGSPVSIHMHPGVVDGIAHDVIEGLGTPLEMGGLLLGRVVAGPRLAVWIERYQRISCDHRFGPQFILDTGEIAALEDAAANVLAAGELAVVGLYRTHRRPGFQVEKSDFDLIRRYFGDPSDLILLIKAGSGTDIFGQFHAWDAGGGAHAAGAEFPFHGHAPVTAASTPEPFVSKPAVSDPAVSDPAASDDDADVPTVPHPRRLVPDFAPSQVEPAPLYGLGQHSLPELSEAAHSGFNQRQETEELTAPQGTRDSLKKWLPLGAALLLVGAVLWFLLQPSRHGSSNPVPAETAEASRPLGLYVDAAGPAWRISWNPKATALLDARNVQLFVREKDDQGADDQKRDDQNRIDLSTTDLASGSREYRPVGNDVTFRLEVTDRAGRVSAESFRLMRTATPTAPSPAPRTEPAPTSATGRMVQPKAIYRAPPVIAAGIRPRIKGTVPIDVRVQIDARGRVVSAVPVTKQHSGLDEYLAKRAVLAARLWRFEPARENGKAVAGTQIIHFVFEK